MQPIIIHIQQGNKQCEAIVMEGENGKAEITLKFRPCFPTMSNTLYEKIAAAVYNEVKNNNND